MKRIAPFLFTLLVLFILGGAGCKENCSGVECAPAPPLLQIHVLDSMRIDTVLIDSLNRPIDTTVLRPRNVTDATVVLQRIDSTHRQINGKDTVVHDTTTFMTVPPSGDGYLLNSQDGLHGGGFLIRAERGSRYGLQRADTIRAVEGCCPYSVIGAYHMMLAPK
ncbi:MAG: hypothetical protein JWQ98_3459 [Chlorobi bacterium]|nr:hypothetical protein [Chlorobiota bacterium]